MAPFRRRAWDVRDFAEFAARFNATVPRHELGEGNTALVVVRNGTAAARWLRGKDNHWRVRVRPPRARFLWVGSGERVAVAARAAAAGAKGAAVRLTQRAP